MWGGAFGSALAKAGYKVIGSDVSMNTLREAKRAYPELPMICCQLDNGWPLKSKAVDVIVCTEVIEHVFGVRGMLKEMNRVLRYGGLIIVTTPYHGILKNLAIVLLKFDAHFCDLDGGHIRFFTDRSVQQLLEQSGFQTVEWHYIGRLRPFARSVFVVAEKVGDG